MKKNRLIIVLFLLIGLWSNAQTVSLKGSTHVSAVGSGTGGIPTLTWDIPDAENRVMVVMIDVERDHRPSPFGDNYPGGATYDVRPAIKINGLSLASNYINTGHWSNPSNDDDWTIVEHTNSLYIYTLTDAQGLPTGVSTFDFSGIKLPKTSADEISVTVLVYENVSMNNPFQGFNWGGNKRITSTNLFTLNAAATTTSPPGRVINDLLYVSLFGASFVPSTANGNGISASGWTRDRWEEIANSSGTAFGEAGFSEPDGISTRVYSRKYTTATTPSITYTRTSSKPSIQGAAAYIFGINPLAKPSISGRVYNDTDGLPDINGTPTNAGGLYVNVIDEAGKLVYSALVNSAAPIGNFIVPTGHVLEGKSYKLELSKNTGIIGNNAPIKELPTNWTTVGESTTPSGNDGIHNGTIELTIKATNITGLNYGIKTCLAGNTAPPVQNLSNICPLTTVNLNNAHTGTIPTGATVSLLWFDNNLHTGTPLSGTGITEAGAGTYFAFYYDSAADCYSLASNTVTVTITNCATCTNSGVTSVNLNQLYTGTFPAGVVLEWWTSPTRDLPPTPGTKVLDPTNVTVSGTYYAFFYDTVNNCYNTDNSTAAVVVNILPPCATCTNPGSTAIRGNPTKMGITVQQKQETWPQSIKNGFIALQSQNKGMVITRVATVGGGTGGAPNLTTDSIKDPKEGMLVYDLAADCVKLYNGTIWKCLAKDCL